MAPIWIKIIGKRSPFKCLTTIIGFSFPALFEFSKNKKNSNATILLEIICINKFGYVPPSQV